MNPLSPAVLAAVAAGGAAGSLCRYLVSVATVAAGFAGPFGTLAVNVVGGVAIGVLAELFAREMLHPLLRPLLITGVLGGFTTFSAFSLEAVGLWRQDALLAALYIVASVALSLKGCIAGLWLARTLA